MCTVNQKWEFHLKIVSQSQDPFIFSCWLFFCLLILKEVCYVVQNTFLKIFSFSLFLICHFWETVKNCLPKYLWKYFHFDIFFWFANFGRCLLFSENLSPKIPLKLVSKCFYFAFFFEKPQYTLTTLLITVGWKNINRGL